MRINKFIASRTTYSRRSADELLLRSRVTINGMRAYSGMDVQETDVIEIDGKPLEKKEAKSTVLLHKPVGYVCSRDGQGSRTIYELLPTEYHHLDPAGRLDKGSSGLVVMTNDGDLLYQLTHPKHNKTKTYTVTLNKPIPQTTLDMLAQSGVDIGDPRPSRFKTRIVTLQSQPVLEVQLEEGRNRQIRRTFEALGYRVKSLHRIKMGEYTLGNLKPGDYSAL